MPGLNQLKKFNDDILNVGDEVRIRAKRGEKPVSVPLPQNISVEDDSDEFVLGLPVKEEPVADSPKITSPTEDISFDDIEDLDSLDSPSLSEATGDSSIPALDDILDGDIDIDDGDFDLSEFEEDVPAPKNAPSLDEMSLDDLLSGAGDSDDFEVIPDFEEEAEAVPDEVPEAENAADDFGLDAVDEDFGLDSPVEEFNTDALDSPVEDSGSGASDFEMPDFDIDSLGTDNIPEETGDISEPAADDFGLESPVEEFSTDGLDSPVEDNGSGASDFEMPDFGEESSGDSSDGADFGADLDSLMSEGSSEDGSFDANPVEGLGDIGGLDAPVEEFNTDSLDSPVEEFSTDSLDSPVEEFNTNGLDSPVEDSGSGASDFEMPDFVEESSGDSSDGADFGADLDSLMSEGSSEDGSFDANPVEGLGDIGGLDAPVEEFNTDGLNSPVEEFSTDGLDSPVEDGGSGTSDFEMPDFGEESSGDSSDGADFGADLDSLMSEGSSEDGSFDANPVEGLGDIGGLDFGADSSEKPSEDDDAASEPIDASMSVPDFGEDSGNDFGFDADSFLSDMGIPNEPEDNPSSDSESNHYTFSFNASDMPQMAEDDFEMSNPEDFAQEGEPKGGFVIPGFSDTTTAKIDKKGKQSFKPQEEGEKPKNTLTDEEYVTFRENFATYPLNLRVALEEFVIKDEFTDDAVFDIVEKVLKKAPARQVASALEKLMDVSIPVPRDYERRSVTEYEAYKQSFQYQLKNRIIPGAIAAIVLGFIGYALFLFGSYFIYRPLKADSLYKQGYVLLEGDEFSQSDILFNKAVDKKPVKKWFFKYAEGYRERRQYERAAKVYKGALFYFAKDKAASKKAGLDWANMNLYELANFQQAEEICRRQVLDKHINDPDGYLLLGDIFLEWADTEKSPVREEKFEEARSQYARLINLYGSTDLYMSRMMRYFIRLDGTNSLRRILELKSRFYPNKKSLSGDDWIELSGYLLDKLYGDLTPNEEPLRPLIEDLREMLERGTTFSPSNPVGHYNIARYYENTENFPAAKSEFKYSLSLFEKAPVRSKKNIYREINAFRHLGELYTAEHEFLLARETFTEGVNLYQKEVKANALDGTSDIGVLFADLGDIDYFIGGDMEGALYNYTTSIKTFNDNPYLRYKVGNIYYTKHDYSNALGSFIKASETKPQDQNLLLALGNTLSLRGDNFASLAYYDNLMEKLDFEKSKRNMLIPEINAKDAELLDMYIKSANNIGVTQYKLAKQTGNSQLNAKALVNFSSSIRAYDALTRDKTTMVRIEGSNLAAQNSKYVTHSVSDFEPALYTEIPRTLIGEKGLQ